MSLIATELWRLLMKFTLWACTELTELEWERGTTSCTRWTLFQGPWVGICYWRTYSPWDTFMKVSRLFLSLFIFKGYNGIYQTPKGQGKAALTVLDYFPLFLDKIPFCFNWRCHNANAARKGSPQERYCSRVGKWGQERSELASEEREVLSAGCRLHSLSGGIDKTVIGELEQLHDKSGVLVPNPCQTHSKWQLILDYNSWQQRKKNW